MISSGFLLPFISFFVVIIIHNPWLMGIPFLTNQFAMAWRCRSSTLLNGCHQYGYRGTMVNYTSISLESLRFTPITVVIHVHTMLYIYIYPLISGTALPNIPSRLTGHLHGKPLDVHPKSEDDRSKSGADSMVITFLIFAGSLSRWLVVKCYRTKSRRGYNGIFGAVRTHVWFPAGRESIIARFGGNEKHVPHAKALLGLVGGCPFFRRWCRFLAKPAISPNQAAQLRTH